MCFRAGWLLQISECIPLVWVISAWLLHEQPLRPSVCDLVSDQTVCQILMKFDIEVFYKKLPSQCQFCDSRLNDTGRRPQIISTFRSIFLDWFRWSLVQNVSTHCRWKVVSFVEIGAKIRRVLERLNAFLSSVATVLSEVRDSRERYRICTAAVERLRATAQRGRHF